MFVDKIIVYQMSVVKLLVEVFGDQMTVHEMSVDTFL
jgi:hypothetical protein